MEKKILINTSNLHGGGGVAVATSFISELVLMSPEFNIGGIIVSSEIDSNLKALKVDTSIFDNYSVVDFYGLSAIWKGIDKLFESYDVIFTLFGPAYFLGNNKNHIVGFAQPWIIYPFNEVYAKLTLIEKLKLKTKYFIQSLFFARADELIVELEHVKKGLENYSYLKKIPTSVVHSTIDSIYFDSRKWLPVNFPLKTCAKRFGVICKNFIHKNLAIFPKIKNLLKFKYNFEAEFFVTLSPDEWDSCTESFKKAVFNIGSLKLNQCPSFYQELDAVIFPSLLECFSATPLEAMIMKKPLFASDLIFIKDYCNDHATYINPVDEYEIAEKIVTYFKVDHIDKLESSYEYAKCFSTSRARAQKYLNIITR